MSTPKPIPCRKCGKRPVTEQVDLYGIRQVKVSCPKCGLSIYTPLSSKLHPHARWNQCVRPSSFGINEQTVTVRFRKQTTTEDPSDFVDTTRTPKGFLAEECHNGTPFEDLY